MENIMVLKKGHPEYLIAIGEYKKHLVEMYKPDKNLSQIFITGAESIMVYQQGEPYEITLNVYFEDGAELVIKRVTDIHINKDQPKEAPDSAKL